MVGTASSCRTLGFQRPCEDVEDYRVNGKYLNSGLGILVISPDARCFGEKNLQGYHRFPLFGLVLVSFS